eukprot:NODE_256_length_12667_cov_0.196292.p1 type:complete len:622 gc:universal NODE_256_length_12667_cov_0.196292:11784-9919(-)
MELSGAFISNSRERKEVNDIILPFQNEEITHIALDLGGTLAKVVYFTKRQSTGGRLIFTKFETQKINELIDFLKNIVLNMEQVNITATGGGAHKFASLFKEELGIVLDKHDEMDCTVKGMNFLLKEIPYEVFSFNYKNELPIQYIDSSKPKYPFLLVNIGSGVSIIKVSSDREYERISGSSVGGATFLGLTSLFSSHSKLNKLDFDEILDLTKKGNNNNVDLLVGDIYGTDYSKIGLKSSTIASSCGKIFKQLEQGQELQPEDISLSLLYMISNNIGQIAYLHAKLHNIENIFFSGFFIRGHPTTITTLSYAINYWSKGEMQALFSRHEGFLGALGAFLSMKSKNRNSYHENFMHSAKFTVESLSRYGVLDSASEKLLPFALLLDPLNYHPDTYLLDDASREYYLNVLQESIPHTIKIAVECNSSISKSVLQLMINKYDLLFREKILMLRTEPLAYGEQSFRTIINLREQCLREVGFNDLYAIIKRKDNEMALARYTDTINALDRLYGEAKVKRLIIHVLAGNMFDWGSTEVSDLVEKGAEMFGSILNEMVISPVYNDMDRLASALSDKSYSKCILFVDNSGCDIILGMLPLTRYLLSKGTECILAANSFPALNDITVISI